MIYEFGSTSTGKVQNGETELRKFAVLTESQTTDFDCCFTIPFQRLKTFAVTCLCLLTEYGIQYICTQFFLKV